MWGYMSNKNYEISSNHSRHALSDSQLIYALEFGITVIQNKPWKIIAVAWGFGFTQDKIWFDEFYSLKLVLYKLHFKFNTIRLNVQALLSLTPENLTKSCRDYFQNFDCAISLAYLQLRKGLSKQQLWCTATDSCLASKSSGVWSPGPTFALCMHSIFFTLFFFGGGRGWWWAYFTNFAHYFYQSIGKKKKKKIDKIKQRIFITNISKTRFCSDLRKV